MAWILPGSALNQHYFRTRVGDRWAELEEFVDHAQLTAGRDSHVRLFEELGHLHAALGAVWEPSPPEPLDDHRTFGQLRYSVGFTRRRLGPDSDPVVRRMRLLTGEPSRRRREVELPFAPIHGDYKLGNAGEVSDGSWVTFDLDLARVRERLYDVAASPHQVARCGESLEPRRLLDAYQRTAPEPLTRDEHIWLPPSYPCTGLPPQGSWRGGFRVTGTPSGALCRRGLRHGGRPPH